MHKFLIGIMLAIGLAVFGVTGALAAMPGVVTHDFAPHSAEWDAFYLDRYADMLSITPQGSDTPRDLLPGCHAKDSTEPDVSGDF